MSQKLNSKIQNTQISEEALKKIAQENKRQMEIDANKKQAEEKQKIQRFQKFPGMSLYFDMARVDNTWKQYDEHTMPLYLVEDATGKIVENVGQKALIANNKFQQLLPSTYTYFPHKAVVDTANRVMNTTDIKKYKLEWQKEYPSHGNKSRYWTLLTNQTFNIKDESDKVKVGIVLRNSIGGMTALGIDVFTFRLVCENGAVRKMKHLHNTAIRHVGKSVEMLRAFETGFINALDEGMQTIKVYQKADKITVTDDIANQMFKKLEVIGDKYLPDEWKIKPKDDRKKLKKEGKLKSANDLVTVGKKITLWDTFNKMTEKQRDQLNANKIAFSEVAWQQNRLHEAVIEIVNTRRI